MVVNAQQKKIPLSKFLKSLSKFPSGDDNSYPWSTRLPKGADQFLQDLKAEWNIPNKSGTLRLLVQIVYSYIDKLEDIDIGNKVEDTLYYLRANREKEERDEMRAELYKMVLAAEAEDYMPLRARLKTAARKMADRYNLPWPLPEIPLTQRDSEANYLLDRIMSIMQADGVNEITLRELVRRSKFDADLARDVITRLEEAGCLATRQESRSGPPTLVIVVPTLQEAFAYAD
jgi:predicted transcriptional regulator